MAVVLDCCRLLMSVIVWIVALVSGGQRISSAQNATEAYPSRGVDSAFQRSLQAVLAQPLKRNIYGKAAVVTGRLPVQTFSQLAACFWSLPCQL